MLRIGASFKIALIMLMTLAWVAILFWKVFLTLLAVFVISAAAYWAAAPRERTRHGFREDLTGRPYW